MPGRDETGPVGMRTMSGSGMGICRRANETEILDRCGFGYGHGFRRNGSLRSSDTKAQQDYLTEQKTFLENRLKIINHQLESL